MLALRSGIVTIDLHSETKISDFRCRTLHEDVSGFDVAMNVAYERCMDN